MENEQRDKPKEPKREEMLSIKAEINYIYIYICIYAYILYMFISFICSCINLNIDSNSKEYKDIKIDTTRNIKFNSPLTFI